MNRIIALVAASLFAVGMTSNALATPQQDRMKSCNAEAKGKKGDERKVFMKSCLSGDKPATATGANSAASADCEKKAVSKDGKPLAGAAKASFMKKCAAETK
ncbi:MAG: phosphate starvation-inducible protein PsiF [Rhodocyclaceae bacterium]|nr:phosphate starvation-inducible protein PsiF [Rhodocyclaceae bacterium]